MPCFWLAFVGLGNSLSVNIAAFVLAGLVVTVVCLRYPFVAAAFLISAMLFSPEIQPVEGVRLRAEDVIIPLLGVALAARACIPRFRVRFRGARLDLAIVALMLVNIVASIRGVLAGTVSPFSSILWNGKILEMFLIYWLTFNYVRTPTQIRRLIGLVLVVLLAITAYAFTQIPGTQVHTMHRLTAPFEGNPEPTTLGGYLTILLAIIMAMAIYESSRRRRILWWGVSGIVLVPILFTLSRTTYVSCVFMICALAILTRRKDLLFIMLLVLCLAPLILPDKIVERVLMTLDSTRQLGVDVSTSERIFVWHKFFGTLGDRPFFGYGVPQFILDNQYVRIMCESGLLGLTGWGVIFYLCFRMGRRLHRRAVEPFHKALAAGYIVGVLALLVHALAATTFYIVRIMEPFWFLTGVMASLNVYYRERELNADNVRDLRGLDAAR